MIDSEAIERAERVLSVVYGQGMERQLEVMQVDADAFYGLIEAVKQAIKNRYGESWQRMDPRLEPAINTAMGHAFAVGVVCGRESVRKIL